MPRSKITERGCRDAMSGRLCVVNVDSIPAGDSTIFVATQIGSDVTAVPAVVCEDSDGREIDCTFHLRRIQLIDGAEIGSVFIDGREISPPINTGTDEYVYVYLRNEQRWEQRRPGRAPVIPAEGLHPGPKR